MSALQGLRGQDYRDRLYDASGTVTTGGTPQLILPEAKMRSSVLVQNISTANMYLEVGSARASATISSGSVNAVSVTNAGFGYSIAPTVKFLGGAYPGSITTSLTFSLPSDSSWPSPQSPAKAHCIMTGSAPNMTISSIVIDSGGSGYQYPPYVLLTNSLLDPWGAAIPSTTSGIEVPPGGAYSVNASMCPTDQIAVFCATTSSAYTCKFTL